MVLTLLTRLQIAVTNANGSESSLSVGCDNVLNLLASIILKGLNLALLVHERVASSKHKFRGTLDEESLVITTITSSVLDNCGHSLAAG